jgi:thiol-disulfide isomerase/thioredoxin
MSKRLLTIVLVSAAGLLAPGRARAQEGGIALGAAAPGAAVETLDGRAADLGALIQGKPAVLEFWATWCPLCKELEPQFEAAHKKYAGRVTFVSVGVKDNQSAAKQKAYAESKHLGGEFVFDRDGKAVAAYKTPHTSYVVVVDASGKVVYTGVGPEQNIDAAVAKALPMGDAMHDGMSHDGMSKGMHDGMSKDGMGKGMSSGSRR